MEDWIKIDSFDRIHQAELRKDILEKNGIEAYIINERDSLFLIGEIELYVKKEDVGVAKALIEEFSGLTKINSFFLEKPIRLFYELLKNQGIDVILKRKEDTRYILDNFELFVKNEDVLKVIPFLTGEKLDGWQKIDSCSHTRQTRFRVEILEENKIDTIIVKKKDSEYHLERINIYVRNENAQSAQDILKLLNGWIKIKEYDKMHRAEIREDLLGKHNIKSIIIEAGADKFWLYVECHNEEKAIEIINEHRNWTKIFVYQSELDAQYVCEYLEENGVNAIVINRKDSTFLMGEVELYVDDFAVEKANKLISDMITSDINLEELETE